MPKEFEAEYDDDSDADFDYETERQSEIFSHRNQSRLPKFNANNMQALRLGSTFQYINDYDLITLDLPLATPPATSGDIPLLQEPALDVDKFFVKVPTNILTQLSPFYSAKPHFVQINNKFADFYTLQIVSEPLIVSIPLCTDIRAKIVHNLLTVADICCYPPTDTRLLTSRQCTITSKKLLDVLLSVNISSIFVSSYGGKMDLREFNNLIGQYAQDWSEQFVTNLRLVISRNADLKAPYDPNVITQMNNTFDVGKTYHTFGKIYTFTALGQKKNNLWRSHYHLLGALTDLPYTDGIRFGGLRFLHKSRNSTGTLYQHRDRVVGRTIYLV
jgi:hypothetical protein